MKKVIILAGAGILAFQVGRSQKTEKISINNSLVAVTFEAAVVDQTLKSEGDAKYYSLRSNSNGFGGVKTGTGSGFDGGFNFEFSVAKNARNFSFFTGIHFKQVKTPIFVSQGHVPNDIFNRWAIRYSDSIGNMVVNTVRLPVGFNFFITIGKKKNVAIGIDLGADLHYNFSADLNTYDGSLGKGIAVSRNVSPAVTKFNVAGFGGARLKYKRLYAFYQINAIGPKNVWTKEYGSNEETKQTYQRLGVGFYIKK